MARQGITGHSMGGHGALTIALRNPGRFTSVSAFAPIVSPLNCPWGEKALGGYLGPDKAAWREYDACALIEDGARLPDLLVDQGEADNFLHEQLKPGAAGDGLRARPGSPRRSGCSRATITRTISSRASWPNTSAGMPSGWAPALQHSSGLD